MPKFVTENDFTNRKVKYQSAVTGVVTFIMSIVGVLYLVKPQLAQSLNINQETLTIIGMAIAAGVAGVVSLVSWISGYFTNPGEGDGVVKIEK